MSLHGCCGRLAISAGTESVSRGTVSFANSNGITFGMAGSTITASINPMAGTAITAISAGTTFATGPTVVFSNSNGISFGVNGNTVTASIAAQSTPPIVMFSQWGEFGTNFTVWPGQASFQKVSMPMAVSGSSGAMLIEMLGNSDSSGGVTVHVGAYQLTGSTAQSLTSRSMAFTWTSGSDTTATNLYGGASGTRYRSFPWDVSMTPGDYLFAFVISTQNDGTCRVLGRQGVNIVGSFAGFETNYFVDGYTNSTIAALPGAIVANNTNYIRTGLSALRQPGFILFGTN